MARLTSRVVVSESALETARANWYDAEYVVLWNGIEVERFASATPTPPTRPAAFFVGRHEPRKGLAVLLDAWRALDRDAVLWVGGDRAADRRAAQRARSPNVEWLGCDHRRRAQRAAARRDRVLRAVAARRVVRRRAARGDGRRHAGGRVGDRGLRNVARADLDALLVPPGDVDALRGALRRVLDDAGAARRLVAAGRARADEFSMARLAARYLELYENALVPAP